MTRNGRIERDESGEPTRLLLDARALPARGDHKQTWATPWHIVQAVERDSFGGVPFSLDVAASAENTKAVRHYALPANGLREPWEDRYWCNPPYEEQDKWLARGAYLRGSMSGAFLVLASTSSLYWRRTTFEAGTVDFYEGRIAFLGDEGEPVAGTSFSSALVLYGPRFKPGVIRVRSAITGEIIGEEMQRRLW